MKKNANIFHRTNGGSGFIEVCMFEYKDYGAGNIFIRVLTFDYKGHGLVQKGHGRDQCVTLKGHGLRNMFLLKI